MAGSIRKRPDRGPNTWQLRVYVGRDSNGRIRHRSHTFQGSKRAAEKELARLVLDQDATPAQVIRVSLAARARLEWFPGAKHEPLEAADPCRWQALVTQFLLSTEVSLW